MTTSAEVTATGLFDSHWYLAHYPDISTAGVEPVEHYTRFGQSEGRKPNPYFDEPFYRSKTGDLGDLMPLLHYARVGEADDLHPGPFFDPPWYRQAYQLPRSISALADFLRNQAVGERLPSSRFYFLRRTHPYAGIASTNECFEAIVADLAAAKPVPAESDLIRDTGLFDANHYLINGSDVHEALLDPIEHFCIYGWREGRQPNIYFNPTWYIRTNPQLRRLDINPLTHYIFEGEQRGRRPVVYFEPTWYQERYAIFNNGLMLSHFLEHRRSQKFSPNSQFDLEWYVQKYAQELGLNRDPFAHYLQSGTYKDIWPSATFNPATVRKSSVGRRSRNFCWRLHPDKDNPLIRLMHANYR